VRMCSGQGSVQHVGCAQSPQTHVLTLTRTNLVQVSACGKPVDAHQGAVGAQAAAVRAAAQAAADGLVADVNATLGRVNGEINATLVRQRADGERRLDEAQARALGEVAALAAALRRQGIKV